MKKVLLAFLLVPMIAFASTNRLSWNSSDVVIDARDGETVTMVFPYSANMKVSAKLIGAYQVLDKNPCPIRTKITNGQFLVSVYLGETNTDDGANGCELEITNGQKVVSAFVGYHISE